MDRSRRRVRKRNRTQRRARGVEQASARTVSPDDLEPPASFIKVQSTIHWIEDDGTVSARSLEEILTRRARVPAEADTPVIGPQSLPPAAVSQVGPHDATPFSLDSIVTPNTFSVIRREVAPLSPSVEHMSDYLTRQYTGGGFRMYESPSERQYFFDKCIALCQEVLPILAQGQLFVAVKAPVYVLGDIHGNFEDLSHFARNILTFSSIHLTPCNILCLGDYVDRGLFSLECMMFLLSWKIQAPHKVTLLRGNHEDAVVCGDRKVYGRGCFLSQCHDLFGAVLGNQLFDAVTSLFRHFPLACEVQVGPRKIFCSHGGFPRFQGDPREHDSLGKLNQPSFPRLLTMFPNNPIARGFPDDLDRCPYSPDEKKRAWYSIFDLMWSDPTIEDNTPDLIMDEWGFATNLRGGNVVSFSQRAVETFLQAYGYDMLFRAHQEKAHGLRMSKSRKVFTIFSSSNYQGHGNGAGCVIVGADGVVQLVVKSSQ